MKGQGVKDVLSGDTQGYFCRNYRRNYRMASYKQHRTYASRR